MFSLFEGGGDDEKIDKDKVTAAIKPIADRMVTELRRSFDYFSSQLGGGDVKKIILSGGGASLKGLPEYLTAQLNVPVVLFDPLTAAVPPPPAGRETLNSQIFASVVGMGMRLLDGTPLDINLIPANIQAIRRMRSMGRDLKYLAIAAGLLLAQLGVYAFMITRNQDTLYRKLQGDVQELESVVMQTRQLEKDQKTVNDLEKSIASLVSAKAKWIPVLVALDRTLPDNASVRSMSMPAKDQIALQVIANSLTEIPDIGKRFQSPEYTKNYFSLTNKPSPRKTNMGGIDMFEVQFDLRVDHTAVSVKSEPGGA